MRPGLVRTERHSSMEPDTEQTTDLGASLSALTEVTVAGCCELEYGDVRKWQG